MDTPTCPRPRDSREQNILDNLILARDKLLLLKLDQKKHLRTQDVVSVYEEVFEQVRQLNEIRADATAILTEETQLDRVLESCFQLLSLSFMTIGRNHEAIASYALTSTIRRLLDHLLSSEQQLYSSADLASLAGTISHLDRVVQGDSPAAVIEAHVPCEADDNGDRPLSNCRSPELVALLAARLERLRADVATLQQRLGRLQEPLPDLHERLIGILKNLALANTRQRFSEREVLDLKAELEEIDGQRKDGMFVAGDGAVPSGNEQAVEVLNFCLQWADSVLEHKGIIPASFQPTYKALLRIRSELEKLCLTQSWSMRETMLFDYQRRLDRLDETRKDGRWVDEDGNPASQHVQWTFIYLIRRSYGLIYTLLIASEPVSEALLPVLTQLQTLKRCLRSLNEEGGVESIREMYPYMLKLESIQKLRKRGKFMVGDDVPDGQHALLEHLAECVQLTNELKAAVMVEAGDS